MEANDGPPATNAHQLHLGLVEEFKRRGWPAEVESAPLYGEWLPVLSLAGPRVRHSSGIIHSFSIQKANGITVDGRVCWDGGSRLR
ncbi:MAG: hypothetical protein H0U29_08390 [Acidimicrobiia bacterium]|nr:hypothetical protein [Acidimicrobiia bacterium]